MDLSEQYDKIYRYCYFRSAIAKQQKILRKKHFCVISAKI